MRFNISSFVVPVRVKEGRLFDDEGREQAGLFVYAERAIYLAGIVPPKNRLHVLLHELRHAWNELCGRGGDADEDDANNVAAFTAACHRQLNSQGGELALMRLGTDGTVDRSANVGAAGAAPGIGGECVGCGQSFPAHKVVTSAATFDDAIEQNVVTRRLWCEHCGKLQRWVELASPRALPTLVVVRGPEFVREPAEVLTFLREHGPLYGLFVD